MRAHYCFVQGFAALLFVGGLATASSAATFILTSEGLGRAGGAQGSSMHVEGVEVRGERVSDGIDWGSDGSLFLGHNSEGLGVSSRGPSSEGQVSSDETGHDRIEFDLSNLYEMHSVDIGLNWFDTDSDEVAVEVIGTEATVNIDSQTVILAAYERTGLRSGVIHVDDLLKDSLVQDIGSIQLLRVQSRSGHFWINELSTSGDSGGADPVPDPASLWLLGSGLAGFAGWRRLRGDRA